MAPDLRAQKKIATRRALVLAARELTDRRGLMAATVEEIADAAGVSPRTFFNYFACKEDAIVGPEPNMVAAMVEAVEQRPADEHPLLAVLAVLGADDDSELAHRWMMRIELVRRHPDLLPRYMASVVEIERRLIGAVARRMGVDPEVDPYPKWLVAMAVATLRSTIESWHESGHQGSLRDVLNERFDMLAAGMPLPSAQSRS
jgi:AcrR family transcriptional regulator